MIIVPAKGRVIADKVHFLDDSRIRDDFDEASLDDVGIRSGLAGAAKRVGVRQDQSLRAPTPWIESIDLAVIPSGRSHAVRARELTNAA